MPVTYDTNVMVQSAEKLYSRANGIAFGYGLRGVFLGGVAGLGVGVAARSEVLLFIVGGLVVGLLIGLNIGWEKAFSLRLEAQRTLCMLQTEINTRPRT